MGRVSRFAVLHPWRAIAAWVAFLVVAIGLTAGFAGSYNDSFTLPNSESATAFEILAQDFPQAAATSATIVFGPTQGTIEDPAVKAAIEPLLADIAALAQDPGSKVAAVTSPYQPVDGDAPAVSPDGTVGRGTVVFTEEEAVDVPTATVKQIVDMVEAANSPTLQVGVSGDVVAFATQEPPSSEIFGIGVALIIMLIMFGALVAAGLPILVALIGLISGLTLVTLLANWFTIATFGPTIAAMIGLGVGIDYSLFIINRYRQAIRVGRDPKAATLESVNTAGRAVVFAAIAVVIALCGLFALGIEFMNGLGVAAAVTVVMTMLTAVTLLPALLSLLGTKAFAVRMPWARRPYVAKEDGGAWSRWGALISRRHWLFAGVALVVMVIFAIPVTQIQSGFSDASTYAPGNPQRTAYELTAKGFGPGANGQFLVVVELPAAGEIGPAQSLAAAIAGTPGVACPTPDQPENCVSVIPGPLVPGADGQPVPSDNPTVALLGFQPTTGPQNEATPALLDTLRQDVIPATLADTGASAYVGGTTAISDDFGQVITDALPRFLLIVVGLGFLVLVVLFRSILVPLTGAVTSLLSLGASLGAVVAVFQWGWFAGLFGVEGTGPIEPFIPVMMFAILFGLSMDYQVFLASRIQEEWLHTGDNKEAIRRGMAGSGKVVTAAALIMASVFIAFIFTDERIIKIFGLGLGLAILLDAFVIRLILIPALMSVFGRANWWVPGWLDKILPRIDVEGADHSSVPVAAGTDATIDLAEHDHATDTAVRQQK